MGNEHSKNERQINNTGHRRTVSSVAFTNNKDDKENIVSISSSNLNYQLKTRGQQSLPLPKSPLSGSPQLPKFQDLIENQVGSVVPVSTPTRYERYYERDCESNYFSSSNNFMSKNTILPKKYSSPSTGLLVTLSSSAPISDFNPLSSTSLKFKDILASPSINISENLDSPIIKVVDYKLNSEDPIISKLKTMPKVPPNFRFDSSPFNESIQLQNTPSSTGFPFPSLWPPFSYSLQPTPKVNIQLPDSMNRNLLNLVLLYRCHIQNTSKLILKNQINLATDIKDAEASCAHILTYTSPHLNHLKQSHDQLEFHAREIQLEVQKTRILMKSLFKTIEKFNSMLPQTERLGYLKYDSKKKYPNLHQAYRKAMLKGSGPQLATSSAGTSTDRSSGSGILGTRRRRESAVTLTLDSVLSERHRPYSQFEENTKDSFYENENRVGGHTSVDFTRPLSSASKISIDLEFGTSATKRLHDIAISRPTTSSSVRNSSQYGKSYINYGSTPSLRSGSPTYRNLNSSSIHRSISPLAEQFLNGNTGRSLEDRLLLPTPNAPPPPPPAELPRDVVSPLSTPVVDVGSMTPILATSVSNDYTSTFKSLLVKVGSKVSRNKVENR